MDCRRLNSVGKKLLPLISILFIAIVGFFLYENLSAIKWSEVKTALEKVSPSVIGLTLTLAILAYFILTIYDYMGFRFLNFHSIDYKRIMPTALISYAFNFNLGAIIGGLGFRIRIYSGWNVPKKTIPLVALFSVMTTWVGFIFLISSIFNFRGGWINEKLPLSSLWISLLGALGFLLVLAFLILCAQKRKFKFKGRSVRFPSLAMATLQLLLATVQWCLPAAIIYLFLQHLGAPLGYGQTLFTYLIASVGGVVARIPAGLGVIEAVFLKMQFGLPPSTLLAALLCFRAIYYLFPLALAVPGYGLIEYWHKRKF